MKEREVKLVYVRTNEQVADIFIKPLKIKMFGYLQKKLRVMTIEKTSFKGGEWLKLNLFIGKLRIFKVAMSWS